MRPDDCVTVCNEAQLLCHYVQVFVGGEHIGGSDDTVEAYESGKLKGLVDAALGRKEL